jgi:molybdopterin converting factor subunit 1
MKIRVKLFAILRDLAPAAPSDLDLPEGATVAMAVAMLAKRFPALEKWTPKIAFAVNMEYVSARQPLHDGDELALMPSVSGGAGGNAIGKCSSYKRL